MDDIKDDIREIKSDIKAISETLIKNTASLETHVRRTELAEKRIEAIEVFNRWWLGLISTALLGAIFKFFVK